MRKRNIGTALVLAAGLGLLILAGCDRGGSAAARDHAAETDAPSARDSGPGPDGPAHGERAGYRSGYGRRDDRPRETIPLVGGKPMWSDNRQHTAQENAEYHFEHDGPDFGAKTEKDYIAKAHAFIEHPPAAVQTANRANGDKLMYDAATNTFAVARKDGAPRTMFKPHAGADYWKEQQAKIASGDSGYGAGSRRRYHAPNPREFDRSSGTSE